MKRSFIFRVFVFLLFAYPALNAIKTEIKSEQKIENIKFRKNKVSRIEKVKKFIREHKIQTIIAISSAILLATLYGTGTFSKLRDYMDSLGKSSNQIRKFATIKSFEEEYKKYKSEHKSATAEDYSRYILNVDKNGDLKNVENGWRKIVLFLQKTRDNTPSKSSLKTEVQQMIDNADEAARKLGLDVDSLRKQMPKNSLPKEKEDIPKKLSVLEDVD